MYYGSGTDVTQAHQASGQPVDAAVYAAMNGRQTGHEMTSWPKSWTFDVTSKIGLCQSMHIDLKNNQKEFQPNLF